MRSSGDPTGSRVKRKSRLGCSRSPATRRSRRSGPAGKNPEAAVHEKSRSIVLRKCLSRLSPLQREIVDLVYYHEKSVAEVAQIVGIPVGTVKTRMFRARSRIAELLAEAGLAEFQDC